jgi:hypothetical protein
MHAIVKRVFGFGCFGTLVYCSTQEVQAHVQAGASTSARHARRYASKLESSDLLNGQSLAELHRWLVGAGGGNSGWDFRATVVDLGFSLGDALRFAHCLRERFRSPERPG